MIRTQATHYRFGSTSTIITELAYFLIGTANDNGISSMQRKQNKHRREIDDQTSGRSREKSAPQGDQAWQRYTENWTRGEGKTKTHRANANSM